jgi:hypothetical protein
MLSKIKSVISQIHTGQIFALVQGRHTAFAVFFAGTAFYLALHGKLTGDYAAVITSLQVIILAHSFKEDLFLRQHGGDSPNSGPTQ